MRKEELFMYPQDQHLMIFMGAISKGANLFANCLLALDAEYRPTHLAFSDCSSRYLGQGFTGPPNLLTVNHNGEKIDAVAQVAKSGFVFLLIPRDGRAFVPDRRATCTANRSGRRRNLAYTTISS
jgi:quinoprotein glucose dehydrogenase